MDAPGHQTIAEAIAGELKSHGLAVTIETLHHQYGGYTTITVTANRIDPVYINSYKLSPHLAQLCYGPFEVLVDLNQPDSIAKILELVNKPESWSAQLPVQQDKWFPQDMK